MRRVLAVGAVLLLAGAASAEIYQCPDPAGGLRFTSDPRGCPGAEAVDLDPDRVVRSPAHPEAPAAPSEPTEPIVPDAAVAPIDAARLADFLPPTPRGWEPTHEAVAIERDSALRARGLLASVSRHYGRARGGVTEVCSVELWSFAQPGQAQAALASLDRPQSWKTVSGTLLVIARGVRLEREVGTRHGLVPGCRELAESVDGRARRAPRGSASAR